MSRRKDREQREEVEILKRTEKIDERILSAVDLIVKPRLSFIKIRFHKEKHMAGVGPVELGVGQTTIATVLGFDQFGNPFAIDFTNPANAVVWQIDNPTLASSTPNDDQSDTIANVNLGATAVANLTATCAGFSDTEQVTCDGPTQTQPVLTSIKVSFAAPTGGAPTPSVAKPKGAVQGH